MSAIVDISNRKIRGAKSSYELAHENAHLKFNDSEFGMTIQWIGQISEQATLIFIVLTLFEISIFKWFSLISILVMLICLIFEEVYCSYMGWEEINKKSNKEKEVILDGGYITTGEGCFARI